MASFALLSVLLALITVFHTDASTPGSTPYLRDIIVGRCEDYFRQNTKIKPKNCTEIWKKFHDVFAFKDACSLTPADYEPFFDVMEEGDILNKAMFWSGTYKTAHSYSYFDLKFTTLEDTLAGSMMNDLRWCGNPSLPRSSDGVDYQSCPDCLTYNKFFWIQASKRFAERVTGQARVMVNGTRTTGPAYNSNGSIFGKYELPNLKVPKITKLFIIVIHTIGKEPIEKCGTKSIKQLEKDAKKRNLTVICKNDPDMSKHVLCIDHPEANECRFAEEDPGKQYWRTLAIIFVVLFVVMLVILIIVLVLLYFCRKKRSSASSP